MKKTSWVSKAVTARRREQEVWIYCDRQKYWVSQKELTINLKSMKSQGMKAKRFWKAAGKENKWVL